MHSFLASEENVGYELYDRIWELQQWHVQEGSEIPGDHLSGTPGNVRKLTICEGEMLASVSGKSCQ